MNIEKWLYPIPEVRWSLKNLEGQVIWIPVYKESEKTSLPHAKEKIVNLKSMLTQEEDEFNEGVRWSVCNTEQSEDRNFDPFLNKRYNTNEMSRNVKIEEINQIYRNSLGLPETQDQPQTQHWGPQAVPHQAKEESKPSFFDQLFGTTTTDPVQNSKVISGGSTTQSSSSMSQSQHSLAKEKTILYKIPCLFLRQNQFQTKVLIYFHSNAEDIHLCEPFCRHLMSELNVCVLAMEYPGYGYFKGPEVSEETICENAERVFDFLVSDIGIAPSRMKADNRRHLRARQVYRLQSGNPFDDQAIPRHANPCKSLPEHQGRVD